MAKPTKIKTLAVIREIPFNQLVLSQANVRTVKTGVSIEELSEDIARRGLLQNLYVRPVIGTDGEETGFYEVPAGGRRYRALERLVKAKRLDKAVPVPASCATPNRRGRLLPARVCLVRRELPCVAIRRRLFWCSAVS